MLMLQLALSLPALTCNDSCLYDLAATTMDGYPDGSLDHNVPFIIAAGLNSKTNELPLDSDLKEQGILLRSELPPLKSKEIEVLEQYFEEIDSEGTSWSGVNRDEAYRFRIKSVGRVWQS